MTDAAIQHDAAALQNAETAPAADERVPTVGERMTPATILIIGIIGAVFVWSFYRWFVTQTIFSTSELQDWGHAFAIPLFSGYLIWRDRERLKNTPVAVFWPGCCHSCLACSCTSTCWWRSAITCSRARA